MSARILLSTARRALAQLRHDRRTVAMILVIPLVLLVLVYYLFENQPGTFDHVGLTMLGLFPFVLMFIVTSVAMLRERTSGTLERLLTTPLHKADLLFGYGLAFGLAAAVQAVLATGLAYWALDLRTQGTIALVVVIAVCDAVLGMALGLFFSAFAQSEFQAVQFMPVVIVPQLLLAGIIVPRAQLPTWLEWISNAMPASYALEALQQVSAHAELTAVAVRDMVVVLAFAVVAMALAAATLRRRTP